MTEQVLKKKLCKGETLSNWERRPLRSSQVHYAALDACIMIYLYQELDKKAKNLGLDIQNYRELLKQNIGMCIKKKSTNLISNILYCS